MLIVMAGLPASGKSTIASALALALGASVASVDALEAAMRRAGIEPSQPTGLAAYVVAEAFAESELARGWATIVDAVNAAPEARQQWRDLALRTSTRLHWIEVRCTDLELHRRRLDARRRPEDAFLRVTWEGIEARRQSLEEWTDERLVLDSVDDILRNVDRALAALGMG